MPQTDLRNWLHTQLFERVPTNIAIIDRDYRVVEANHSFAETFGEWKGKHCYEVYKGRLSRCEHCPAEQSFKDGKPRINDERGVDRFGQEAYYVLHVEPIVRDNGDVPFVIEMAQDVSRAHALEERLKQALAFQEKMIENAIDGIIAADAGGRIIIFNPFAEQLFKRSAEEVTGSAIAEFFPPEFAEELRRGGTSIVLMETNIRDREGTMVPVRFYGVALMSGGERLGTACFFRDLRDRKRLERERLDAARLAAVVQTVAGMAHGIKNVLMGLEGGMYVVSSGLKKDDRVLAEKGWAMLEKNIGRISGFMRDFLNFSKVRQLAPRTVDPNQVAREVVELFQDAAHNAGVELRASLLEGIPAASLDLEGIHACLSNLVSNAIDACAAADNREGLVEVRTREAGGALIYEVADNGCGLDDEARQKIFNTVYSSKGSQKGTGLGLLVTRKIVNDHGGAVTFESSLGEGSVFRMEFPRERLPAPAQAAPGEPPRAREGEVKP
jgi:PAS domain S-box-containing protein